MLITYEVNKLSIINSASIAIKSIRTNDTARKCFFYLALKSENYK